MYNNNLYVVIPVSTARLYKQQVRRKLCHNRMERRSMLCRRREAFCRLQIPRLVDVFFSRDELNNTHSVDLSFATLRSSLVRCAIVSVVAFRHAWK